MAPLVRMEKIRRVYGEGAARVEALKGVDLCVEEGEFVAVVGPSGSGKSTLLNILGCLDTPTSGSYRLDGVEVSSMGPEELADVRNRLIGFVFQNFNLLPQLTALENVELPMVFGGVPARERKRRAMELLDRLGLADRATHKPTELSGGQMQRVAIARALAMNPKLILADEPTGNLDSAAGADVLSLLEEAWEEGRTLVVVTHDRELASRAQRILRLRDGTISEVGALAKAANR